MRASRTYGSMRGAPSNGRPYRNRERGHRFELSLLFMSLKPTAFYRREEREMLPLCAAEGIGVIPWSPQARGKLTRDWNYTSIRTETDEAFERLFAKTEDADRKVVDRVAQVAAVRGIPRAQVALAWLLAKSVITAPIVGATKLQHLDDALSSVRIKLSEEEIALLEEPYVPHAVFGFD